MQAQTKDWLEHCELPHGGHEAMMQCEGMLHDKLFWKMMVWTLMVLAVVGMVAFVTLTTPSGIALTKEIILRYYPL